MLLHQEIYKKHVIEIWQDEVNENPDFYGNQDIFLVCNHKFLYILRKYFYPDDIKDYLSGDQKFTGYYDGYYIFPINVGTKGFITEINNINRKLKVKIVCDGFILVRKKAIPYEADAFNNALALMRQWNDYFNNNISKYVIIYEGEVLGEAGKFYGDYRQNSLVQAKITVDTLIKEKEIKYGKQLTLF